MTHTAHLLPRDRHDVARVPEPGQHPMVVGVALLFSPRNSAAVGADLAALQSMPGIAVVDGDLTVEDAHLEVRAYPGVVRAGLGATVWAHAGVVVDPGEGATVYLAPGAALEEDRPGALERADVTVVSWIPPTQATPDTPANASAPVAPPDLAPTPALRLGDDLHLADPGRRHRAPNPDRRGRRSAPR